MPKYTLFGEDIEAERYMSAFSYLTEEDWIEVRSLDLDLAGEFSWIWGRVFDRINETFKMTLAELNKPRLMPPHRFDTYLDWWQSEQREKTKRRKAWRDAARYEAKKEAERAVRETEEYKAHERIRYEGALRLKLLRAGTKRPRGNKRLEQMRGQEELYVKIWKAIQIARHQHGLGASASCIAQTYSEHNRSGVVTRHQIRARCKVIHELEQPGAVWAPERLAHRLGRGTAA